MRDFVPHASEGLGLYSLRASEAETTSIRYKRVHELRVGKLSRQRQISSMDVGNKARFRPGTAVLSAAAIADTCSKQTGWRSQCLTATAVVDVRREYVYVCVCDIRYQVQEPRCCGIRYICTRDSQSPIVMNTS